MDKIEEAIKVLLGESDVEIEDHEDSDEEFDLEIGGDFEDDEDDEVEAEED